jgi:hypothetical protein
MQILVIGGTQMFLGGITINFAAWPWTWPPWPWPWPFKVTRSNEKSYYLRYLLDKFICDLQHFLVWPWEIRSRSWPKNANFGHWRHPNGVLGHYKQFCCVTLNLTPVTLTLTFQGHKVKWKSYYLRCLLDTFICDLQRFLVWPWEIRSRSWPKNANFGHRMHRNGFSGHYKQFCCVTLNLTPWPWPWPFKVTRSDEKVQPPMTPETHWQCISGLI